MSWLKTHAQKTIGSLCTFRGNSPTICFYTVCEVKFRLGVTYITNSKIATVLFYYLLLTEYTLTQKQLNILSTFPVFHYWKFLTLCYCLHSEHVSRLQNITKQDRQCAYNVTMRRVDESVVAVKKQYILFIVLCVHACECVRVLGSVGVCMRIRACSLANPTRNAYAPYCDVICDPSVSNTFCDIS